MYVTHLLAMQSVYMRVSRGGGRGPVPPRFKKQNKVEPPPRTDRHNYP